MQGGFKSPLRWIAIIRALSVSIDESEMSLRCLQDVC